MRLRCGARLASRASTGSAASSVLKLHQSPRTSVSTCSSKSSGARGSVTASIGIAVYPSDGADFAELLNNADSAMYAVKQAGGNAYRFFSGH